MNQIFMKTIITALLVSLSFNASACQGESENAKEPFAFVQGSEHWKVFEVFVPEKYGEYYLTSIYLSKEQSIYVSLRYEQAHQYPGYKESYVELSTDTIDDYNLYVSYTTTEDGAMVMCGGNIIETKLKPLLSAEKPAEVIPAPVSPHEEQTGN